ncbi:transposase [Rhizobium rhizogenes]|nr:transposase [Rhizobium rhizogenes]NTH14085.1 transposase [Rhizobium rhizogenes]NTI30529.1 transposase [Rhizobium rhizogenes]QRM39287.1 transposase [Rhizobium rhizogenes]
MLTTGRDHLTKSETVMVKTIETGVLALDVARKLTTHFQAMIRTGGVEDLDAWLEAASNSLIASFVHGIARDRSAALAAIAEPWSN